MVRAAGIPPAQFHDNLKALLLPHYAEMDENIPAFEAALKTGNKRYRPLHLSRHPARFDTGDACCNGEASDLAWSRTLAFFKEHLGAPKEA